MAVASGPYVFIYRNLRPYFKFTLPSVTVSEEEKGVWESLTLDSMDTAQAYDAGHTLWVYHCCCVPDTEASMSGTRRSQRSVTMVRR